MIDPMMRKLAVGAVQRTTATILTTAPHVHRWFAWFAQPSNIYARFVVSSVGAPRWA